MLTIVFPGLLFVDSLHPDMGLVQACYKPWCPGASSQWGAGGSRFSRHCNPGPHRQDALPQGYTKGDPQVSQYMVPGALRKGGARGTPCLKRTLHLHFGRSSAAYGHLVSQARPTLFHPSIDHQVWLVRLAGFHTEGWGPWNFPLQPEFPPQKSWNWVWVLLWLVCVVWKVCPRSNLRGSKFKIFPGRRDMPPDPPSTTHAYARCYHPVPPELKILYETLTWQPFQSSFAL